MIAPSRPRPILVLGAVTAALMTTAPSSEARTPIRDCGDIAGGGASAITAQGVTCKSARAVARIVPAKAACRPTKAGCTVRGFTCLTGQAGKELFLVHCENAGQTRFIRFEYGS
ncbi:MAG TPA: hypothetical protein VGO80_15220 [Solirubrobacteraceae bacterium]|jgi:hypothetical protein|nr:hypothetical protein [Solirubrobacteraceae bacterium]